MEDARRGCWRLLPSMPLKKVFADGAAAEWPGKAKGRSGNVAITCSVQAWCLLHLDMVVGDSL